MSDARTHHRTEYGMTEVDSIIRHAARQVACENDVSVAAALRLIRTRALESGRFIADVASEIARQPTRERSSP